jgi:hypothetical protein
MSVFSGRRAENISYADGLNWHLRGGWFWVLTIEKGQITGAQERETLARKESIGSGYLGDQLWIITNNHTSF